MTPTLHIVRWNETFESADTRKRERLKFFHAPSGCESRGYLNLVSRFPQDRAMMAFGVFQSLCQLSATLGRSVRGSFKNSDGTPMDLQQISCLLRLESCHVSAALEILTDSRVKWCHWEPSADNLPVICHPSPGFVQGEGQGKGQVEGEGEVGRSHTPGKSASQTQEPSGDNWGDSMPTETARDFETSQKWINSLHPSWKARPHFTAQEMRDLQANARIFFDLTDPDKALLARYMDVEIPVEWNIKPWQPDTRARFIQSVTDVLSHADRWRAECRRRRIDTGLEGGAA